MSALSYKRQLDSLLGKYQDQVECAKEWKSVAENRLGLICSIDNILDQQLEAMGRIGTIFGQDPEIPKFPTPDVRVHSGGDIGKFIVGKIVQTSHFIKGLTKEASDVQDILNGVVQIAAEATSVPHPTSDKEALEVEPLSPMVTSPLEEVYDEIENTEPYDGEQMNLVPISQRPDRNEEKMDSVEAALALFRK